MLAYRSGLRAAVFALVLIPVASCGPRESASAEQVEPESVDPAALRAAVKDEDVRIFYETVGWQAVWDRERAKALSDTVAEAGLHALTATDFLPEQVPGDAAEREAALTRAALDYATALARGRVNPEEVREVYTVPRPEPDLIAALADAVSSGQIGQWFGTLPPQTEEYRALSREFVRYAKAAQQGETAAIQAGDAIHQGDKDPRVPRIVEALASNGYMEPRQAGGEQSQTYDSAVAEAVRRLQEDYGIKADGVVGSGTLELLNAGARDRARQLAINLERRRWLERDPSPTRIDVNTAATFLDYYRGGQLRDHRVVVVGEPGWETPPLGSPMFRLVANPTWTVPKSIEEDELADEGPGYLAANNMVRRDGWIVQLPGPDNALGQVKFDMQNDQSIYLHDTPAKALFAENERHRSHGCVRVENALQFATMIAGDDGVLPEFSKAMETGEENFVKLQQQIPVRLLYHTAFLRDGRIQFRADAYGWDEDVARALGRESRERRTVRHERGRDFGP